MAPPREGRGGGPRCFYLSDASGGSQLWVGPAAPGTGPVGRASIQRGPRCLHPRVPFTRARSVVTLACRALQQAIVLSAAGAALTGILVILSLEFALAENWFMSEESRPGLLQQPSHLTCSLDCKKSTSWVNVTDC